MNKVLGTIFIVCIVSCFLIGCEAVSMPPDAWLDPPRWEQKEIEHQKLIKEGRAGAGPRFFIVGEKGT